MFPFALSVAPKKRKIIHHKSYNVYETNTKKCVCTIEPDYLHSNGFKNAYDAVLFVWSESIPLQRQYSANEYTRL